MEDIPINRDYLRRLFKNALGQTPHDYLLQLHMECTKRMRFPLAPRRHEGKTGFTGLFWKTENGLLLKNVVQIEKKLLHSKGKSAILCIESSWQFFPAYMGVCERVNSVKCVKNPRRFLCKLSRCIDFRHMVLFVMICKKEIDCGVLLIWAVRFAIFSAWVRKRSGNLLCVQYCRMAVFTKYFFEEDT